MEKQDEYIEIIRMSVDRLNFLSENMIKISRLEGGLIHLNIRNQSLNETVMKSVKDIYARAKKNCNEIITMEEKDIILPHDRNWTAEAVFKGNWENSKHLIVNMSVPKFDVVSDLDLRDGLNALGITGVFDATVADFSPMTSKVAEIFLSKADHAARVAIDEEGVTAAAYTVMMMAGAAAPPEEEMDFVLDRPFLFAITGADGLPLFVGVVNRP